MTTVAYNDLQSAVTGAVLEKALARLGSEDWTTLIGNAVRPLVSALTPAAGSTILATDAIDFDVADDLEGLRRLVVLAEYSSGPSEVIYDGALRAPFTTSSTVAAILNGYHIHAVRTLGWPSATFNLRIFAIDTSGNETVPTTYSYIVSNPTNVTAPVVGSVTPVSGSTITNDQLLTFSITDDSGLPLSQLVVTAGFDGDARQPEVAYDQSGFIGRYTGTGNSTVGYASGNYNFTLDRLGGWPRAALIVGLHAVDSSGNATYTELSYTVSNPSFDTLVLMRGTDALTDARDTWEVSGTPDDTGAQYGGTLNTPLRFIHVVHSKGD